MGISYGFVKMRIHKEGIGSFIVVIAFLGIVLGALLVFSVQNTWVYVIYGLAATYLILQLLVFFRIPNRNIRIEDNGVVAPADRKSVV